MDERFFECQTCGNVAVMAVSSGVIPYCCGDEMMPLRANTTDGNVEKHVPSVEIISDHRMIVKVGSMPHPMTEQHHIKFICLETDDGYLLKYLEINTPAEVYLRYSGKPLAVYAYCNIHGLWKVDLK